MVEVVSNARGELSSSEGIGGSMSVSALVLFSPVIDREPTGDVVDVERSEGASEGGGVLDGISEVAEGEFVLLAPCTSVSRARGPVSSTELSGSRRRVGNRSRRGDEGGE